MRDDERRRSTARPLDFLKRHPIGV
jgi:hypothetical protein